MDDSHITPDQRAQYDRAIEKSLRPELHVDEFLLDGSVSGWSSGDNILSILGPTRNIRPCIAGGVRSFETRRNPFVKGVTFLLAAAVELLLLLAVVMEFLLLLVVSMELLLLLLLLLVVAMELLFLR